MTKVQAKSRSKKRDVQPKSGKKSDVVFYLAAIAAVVLALIFVPQGLSALGVSFLADGSSGLNKLFSVIIAAGLGWLCMLPSHGYKAFVELAKGARTEWRKTVKPDRDTVLRTTMMVLLLVALYAMLILLLDWLFGSILRGLIN